MDTNLKRILFLLVAFGSFASLEIFGGVTGKGIQSMIGCFAVGWMLVDIADGLFKN